MVGAAIRATNLSENGRAAILGVRQRSKTIANRIQCMVLEDARTRNILAAGISECDFCKLKTETMTNSLMVGARFLGHRSTPRCSPLDAMAILLRPVANSTYNYI